MQRGYKFYPPKTEVIAHTIPSKSARSNSPPQHFSHPTQWPMSSLRCAGILAILTSPCPKLRRIHGATRSRHNIRVTILIHGKWSVQGCSRHTTTDVTVLKWPKWVIPSETVSLWVYPLPVLASSSWSWPCFKLFITKQAIPISR